MPRKNRFAPPAYTHHVVNRGNERRLIFLQRFDYLAFSELLADSVRRYPVRLHAYCLMPNHFHLVVQPDEEGALSAFMASLTGRYACTFRQQTDTVGHGHVFQRRFWNAALSHAEVFTTVMRYVEANAVRAKLVARAEDWEWGSLHERAHPRGLLSPPPWALPDPWAALVNRPLPDRTLARIRRITVPKQGRPLAGAGARL